MFQDYPDILTVCQMCEILKIGKNSGYALLRSGTIEHIKIGTQYRIPKKWVIDYLKSNRTGA